MDHNTFMEVVKAVARQGSVSSQNIAVRADQKSYTYAELISSAWRISRLLCSAHFKTGVHSMALNHVRGPLTPKEKETMLDLLTPPPSERTNSSSWWKKWLG